MIIAILNYESGNVHIQELPDNISQNEEIEDWIHNELGMRVSDVHYMTNSDKMEVFVDTPKNTTNITLT